MIFGLASNCRPRPTVLWLADKPGWAYDSIVQQVSCRQPDFEHEVFYMMEEHTHIDWVQLGRRMQAADIVVAMHWMYQAQLRNDKDSTVIMVTGHRGLDESE